MPVLAIGGDHSYGSAMKTEVEAVASDVEGAVIANSGHWIMEEAAAGDRGDHPLFEEEAVRVTRSRCSAM